MDESKQLPVMTSSSIMLDALKAPSKGTTIRIRDTGEVLYNITVQSGFLQPSVTDYKRERIDGKPFATFEGRSVYISELPDQVTGTKIKTRDFLYSNGLFKSSNRFLVQGVEYKLSSRGFGRAVLELFLASEDSASGSPLIIFKNKEGLFSGDKRGEMTIFPNAISTSDNLVPHSLIHNGRPTWLLDLALVAEAIWRANAKQRSAASGAAAAGAAAGGGGGGGGC